MTALSEVISDAASGRRNPSRKNTTAVPAPASAARTNRSSIDVAKKIAAIVATIVEATSSSQTGRHRRDRTSPVGTQKKMNVSM